MAISVLETNWLAMVAGVVVVVVNSGVLFSNLERSLTGGPLRSDWRSEKPTTALIETERRDDTSVDPEAEVSRTMQLGVGAKR